MHASLNMLGGRRRILNLTLQISQKSKSIDHHIDALPAVVPFQAFLQNQQAVVPTNYFPTDFSFNDHQKNPKKKNY